MLDPAYMQKQYEDLGLDKENPAIYRMICWMSEEFKNDKENEYGYDFDDFMEKAVEYYNQRNDQEKLKSMFMLFNKNNDPQGINFEDFEDLCDSLLYISKAKAREFFDRASNGSSHINFYNFARVMKNPSHHHH